MTKTTTAHLGALDRSARVLGAHGRGSLEHWGVEGDVDVVMGTLGKAFGVAGAFVAGSRTLIDFLLNRARAFVFTTGAPPALAAAAAAALRIARAEPDRRDRLRAVARRLRAGVGALDAVVGGHPEGHIIPVTVGDADETVSPHLHARAIAAALPDVRLVILPGIGHMPQHAATDEVIAAIDWVSAAGDARRAQSLER